MGTAFCEHDRFRAQSAIFVSRIQRLLADMTGACMYVLTYSTHPGRLEDPEMMSLEFRVHS